MSHPYAFVTLITSDNYLPGALTVAAALKDVHSSLPVDQQLPFQTVCLVTPETVDVSSIKHLRRAFDVVIGVEVIEADNTAGLKLLGRPDLRTVLTKLHIFRLTQFSKIIFLDADVLPLRPLSHLFSLPYEFSAVPDVGWPDIFNSGMMVCSPGEDKFNEIMDIVKSKGSWDGGDQGVLNEWRGDDWHRLSFTYNTTPTAAYTYAPAYERFGSQISAIHFIGPSKPWGAITYRAPGSSSSTSTSTIASTSSAEAPPQRSYAYDSLVDRWYDVYDKHYRPQAPQPEREYQVKKYENVWNEGPSQPAEPQTTPSQPAAVGNVLGLEVLRRMAVEGVSVAGPSGSGPSGGGEGEYRSLPLEGRVDLMRPKMDEPTPAPEAPESEPERKHLPESSQEKQNIGSGGAPQQPFEEATRTHTLPTPGPNEVPPAPYIGALSLPPSAPVTPSHVEPPHTEHHHDHQQSEHHQEPQRVDDDHSHDHHHIPPPPPPPDPPRPHSPPLLSWNPAIEPPPNVAPPPSSFPSDAYFPNAWDITPSAARMQASLTGEPPSDTSSFFQPPPQSHIPERLVQEGHYTNVTGPQNEQSHGAHPTPDRSKVAPVFPWEEKPRRAPTRTFPGTDAPPPGAPYIENAPAVAEPPPISLQPEPPAVHQAMPSPTIGFPSSMTYANAWDSVPSIQKYAARLVKPPHAPPAAPSLASPRTGRKRSESYKSWEDGAEASSMDGDDEDEGDEEDEAADIGGTRKESGKERSEGGKSRRERSGSKSSSGSARKKEYRSYGVQTIPKDVRSQGVQVSSSSTGKGEDGISAAAKKSTPTAKSTSRRGTKTTSPPKIGKIDLPLPGTIMELRLGQEQMASSSPNVVSAQSFMRPTRTAPPLSTLQTEPSGIVSPRLNDPYPFDSPRSQSPSQTSPTTTLVGPGSTVPSKPALLVSSMKSPAAPAQTSHVAPPHAITRTPSNETASSPPTSVGPISPADAQPSQPLNARKPASRSWNPATGVDVFKRGSEEVLARFLRMGSWEDESPRG